MRARAALIFWRAAEILAIVLSFLGRSRIARFLGTKAVLDFVVEVTAIFGREAGHRLSTFLALLAAEPQLITVTVTSLILLVELIIYIVRHLRPRRPGHRPPYGY